MYLCKYCYELNLLTGNIIGLNGEYWYVLHGQRRGFQNNEQLLMLGFEPCMTTEVQPKESEITAIPLGMRLYVMHVCVCVTLTVVILCCSHILTLCFTHIRSQILLKYHRKQTRNTSVYVSLRIPE